MRPQTIHPAPRSTKVPPRFAGWVGPWAQARIERLQALHPDLDIVGSFARVGELDLAALVLKAVEELAARPAPVDPECRPPFNYEAKANRTKLDGQDFLGVWTDGVTLLSEESPEDRKKGFRPAYRFKKGRRYRITIEELPN